MMRLRHTWMLCLLAAAYSGCAARRSHDIVESRLREQSRLLAETESSLTKAQNELAIARQESDSLRQQLIADGKSPILPEQADVLFRATGIKINELLTGSLDRDGQPGDELLSAVVVPHDTDGEPMKLPGEMHLELFDLSQPGEQKRIGEWTFAASDAREHWHSGFLSSGYMFQLPWQQAPSSKQVVLHAQLKTADGREFNTSATIDITPPGPTEQLAADEPFGLELADEPSDPTTAYRPVGGEWQSSPRKFPLERNRKSPDAEDGRLRMPLKTSDSWSVDSIPRYH